MSDFTSIHWQGDWKIETSYYTQDGVKFNGKYWVVSSVESVPWNQPPPDELYWVEVPSEFCPPEPELPPVDFSAIQWCGNWAIETSYYRQNGVKFNDKYWVVYPALLVPWNQPPPDELYWVEVPTEYCPPEVIPEQPVEVSKPIDDLTKIIVKLGDVTIVLNKTLQKEIAVNVDESAKVVEFVL